MSSCTDRFPLFSQLWSQCKLRQLVELSEQSIFSKYNSVLLLWLFCYFTSRFLSHWVPEYNYGHCIINRMSAHDISTVGTYAVLQMSLQAACCKNRSVKLSQSQTHLYLAKILSSVSGVHHCDCKSSTWMVNGLVLINCFSALTEHWKCF